MTFSKLRHRIIFLSPTDETINSMGETIPRYKPFKPYLPLSLQVDADKVYLSHDNDGNAVLEYANGKPYAHKLALQNFSVAGLVVPMSGREYEESQKIRAETTYKISTRFFRNITSAMRILYDNREFEIVSVLDLGGKHDELQIIAAEKNTQTAQTFNGDEYSGE